MPAFAGPSHFLSDPDGKLPEGGFYEGWWFALSGRSTGIAQDMCDRASRDKLLKKIGNAEFCWLFRSICLLELTICDN